MKSVVICGPRRFKKEIRDFAKVLKEKGVVVYEPILNTDTKINELPDHFKYLSFFGLTAHQFAMIRKADAVFVYNKNGYAGVSTTLEIGFAAALAKPIYALSDDEDPCRRTLFDKIIKTPEELIEKL